jgi:hypothetical protein
VLCNETTGKCLDNAPEIYEGALHPTQHRPREVETQIFVSDFPGQNLFKNGPWRTLPPKTASGFISVLGLAARPS